MEKNGGASNLTMEEPRGRSYYRRAGFSDIFVRNRPGIKRRRGIVSTQEYDLEFGELYELIVYPELTIRSKPWECLAKVLAYERDSILFERRSGELAGTPLRIPHRYFEDGRVYRRVDQEND